MDIPLDTLTTLRDEWRWHSRQPASRHAASLLRSSHPDLALAGVEDLGDLVRALDTRGSRTILERAAIVQALLVEARDDEVRRALLQTLLPGIVSVCRRLRFGQGVPCEPGEFMGLALATTTEILTQWAGQSRPYAALDILSALRGRLRRWILREKDTPPPMTPATTADEPSTLDERLRGYLGGPHDRLARLTYALVFEERSWDEVAQSEHADVDALQNELQFFAHRYLV